MGSDLLLKSNGQTNKICAPEKGLLFKPPNFKPLNPCFNTLIANSVQFNFQKIECFNKILTIFEHKKILNYNKS